MGMNDKFKDAIPTSTLVVKPTNLENISTDVTRDSLQQLTKSKIIEFAQQELGIELDHRLSKQAMISKVINENTVNE